MDLTQIQNRFNESKDMVIKDEFPEKGLSIIIPVSGGIEFIDTCLESLMNQKIVDAKYEVIVVFNGIFSETINHLYENINIYSDLNLLILINDDSGAGSARNLGIKNASYSHTTFIDVDDFVSDTYIQSNYNYLKDNCLTISQINDYIDGEIIEENVINEELLINFDNLKLNYFDIKRILTITTCKAIPTKYLNYNSFNPKLRSGEDTVLFTELLITHQPNVCIIPKKENSIYYRNIRPDSVSRQPDSFDFLVTQRLDILKILDPLLDIVHDNTLKRVVIQKYDAQIMFMNRFLKNNIHEHQNLLKLIEKCKLNHFKYGLLNRNIAKTLVISYCFAPYSDTSASVVTKRIINESKIVDVISNNMKGKRGIDNTVLNLVNPYLGKNTVVNKPVSFADFKILEDFIDIAFREYLLNSDRYEKIYTRAMFPISHIPGMFIKKINPNIFWKAEFSDPLLIDIESRERKHTIHNKNFINILKNGILSEFTEYVDDNLFNLVEIIPFALADELVFTNENQMKYMIQRFPDDLQKFIENKSTISKHPTLNSKYYNIKNNQLKLDKTKINIAYFGNFYSNRSVDEIIKVSKSLRQQSMMEYEFYIFTNTQYINEKQLNNLKKINLHLLNTVDYLDFLNLSTRFDALIVFDTRTNMNKPYNPYLPSKISDYIGSKNTIISINEKDSPLDKIKNENIFKIYYDDCEVYEVEELTKHLLRKKEIIIIRGEEFSTIITPEYELEYSNDLKYSGGLGQWSHKIKESPISFEKEYRMTLKNLTDKDLRINIQTNYDKKEIINLHLEIENEFQVKDIENYNRGEEVIIPSNQNLDMEWHFSKEFKNSSFLRASTVKISILK